MGQSMDAARSQPALVGRVTTWTFRLTGGPTAWDWTVGPPDPLSLLSIRSPRSTEKSRHIPVQAHSVTLGGSIRVESGLEHDLVRELDRDRSVVWMVSQPVRLSLSPARGRSRVHTPDLLVLDCEGGVTIWDVRPPEKQDEKFKLVCDLTRAACDQVGWAYRVYGGSSPTHRHNLRWITAYRRPMPWYPNARAELLAICGLPGATIGSVLGADRGSGHLISAMWHHVWAGLLQIDLDQAMNRDSPITVEVGACD